MMYHEFMERTGLQVTEEEFEKINCIYMSCGNDIDNPTFCSNYKKIVAGNPIVDSLFNEINRLKQELKSMTEKRDHMACAYFYLVECYGSGSARRRATKAFENEGEYIKALLSRGCVLEEADKEYLINNL